MLKKTITYTDFNDEEVTEDHYFHLSKAELVELEMSHEGGMEAWLTNIVASNNNKEIIQQFKNIILGAYGVRSADGRRFTKNQTLRDEFESSEAYSALFMELVTNTDAAIEFVNGIIPSSLSAEVAEKAGIDPKVTPLIAVENEEKPEPRVVYPSDINEADGQQLEQLRQELISGRAILMPAKPEEPTES